MSSITGQEGGKEVALGIRGGDNADSIWDHERRQSLLDGCDLGESNDKLHTIMLCRMVGVWIKERTG